jgi:aminoglycoside phosphotransferase (APT) family kinase protein
VTAHWEADLVAVDEALARRLLRSAGRDARSLRHLSEGWDRSVWVADEELVVGFPRRGLVVPMIEREIALLPRLAPLVPAPIPEPMLVGEPSEEFPWPFYATRFLPGEEAASAPLDDEQRVAVGIDLARFLRALHAVELDAELPVDVNGRADMPGRAEQIRELTARLATGGLWVAPPAVEDLLEAAVALAPPRLGTLVHGDLYPRNFLVHEGRLSGVIDWIDLGRSDPAIDLSWLWSAVPPHGRDEVAAAYGGIDEAALLRSRVLAVFFACVILEYAEASGHAALGAFARAAFARTLAD